MPEIRIENPFFEGPEPSKCPSGTLTNGCQNPKKRIENPDIFDENIWVLDPLFAEKRGKRDLGTFDKNDWNDRTGETDDND